MLHSFWLKNFGGTLYIAKAIIWGSLEANYFFWHWILSKGTFRQCSPALRHSGCEPIRFRTMFFNLIGFTTPFQNQNNVAASFILIYLKTIFRGPLINITSIKSLSLIGSIAYTSLWHFGVPWHFSGFICSLRAGVGNFFRPRAVFENFWAFWASLLDKPHHFTMICKKIVLKKLLRGPYSGLRRAVFGPRAGLCPPLSYSMVFWYRAKIKEWKQDNKRRKNTQRRGLNIWEMKTYHLMFYHSCLVFSTILQFYFTVLRKVKEVVLFIGYQMGTCKFFHLFKS